MASFWRGPYLLSLSAILSLIPVHPFLNPVLVYCRIQTRISWCLPCRHWHNVIYAPMAGHSLITWEIQYWFCIFWVISSSIISSINKAGLIFEFVSLSSFFSFSQWGRWGFNKEHLPLHLLLPCSEQWHIFSHSCFLLAYCRYFELREWNFLFLYVNRIIHWKRTSWCKSWWNIRAPDLQRAYWLSPWGITSMLYIYVNIWKLIL